jgi:hypothetical protein
MRAGFWLIARSMVCAIARSSLTNIVDQWRKMPDDMAGDERKRWADIAFRGMSALKKAGVDYTAKCPTTCYKEVQRPDDSDGSVTLTSWST